MRFGIKTMKRGATAFLFTAAMLVVSGVTVNAQHAAAKRALKDHQRQERAYNGNNGAVRDHQRYERRQLDGADRALHNGGLYNNGGYYTNGGGYNEGYYNNNGYGNNNGYYNNNGHGNNNGYYNNGGYYNNRPHRDSRNPVKRVIHHALGGH